MALLPDHPRQDDARESGDGAPEVGFLRRKEEASSQAVPEVIPPAFGGVRPTTHRGLRAEITRAANDWLARTPSVHTRDAYARDLRQFLMFAGYGTAQLESLTSVRPGDIAAWRDSLLTSGQANSSVRRKLTALRSLFSYLTLYGYTGANPAHGKFVLAPVVSKDGRTPGLSPNECRRLLEAPDPATPAGIRDRALLGVLAFTGCRVGELTRLRVKHFQSNGGHKVLGILGKGGKERSVPLHPEAFERLDAWIQLAGIDQMPTAPLFPPTRSPRGQGHDGFGNTAMSRRSVELLVRRFASELGLDRGITVHSLRVTALTTARERGSDIIDLQEFAGHADPRTTLSYIRTRDRLSKSPAYVLAY